MDNPFVDKVSFKYTDVLLITTTTTTTEVFQRHGSLLAPWKYFDILALYKSDYYYYYYITTTTTTTAI